MRATVYLVGILAAATGSLAVPDFSGLPQKIQECITGNHRTDWDWPGVDYQWENLSNEQICKIDNSISHGTPARWWWKHGVFRCVCMHNQLDWMENRLILGKWATWMEQTCEGGRDGIETKEKMCKRQP